MYISSPKKTTLLFKTELSYTFTGGTRDGSFSISQDAPLSVSDEFSQLPSDSLDMPKGRRIHITRARLIATGAEDLQPAVGKVAAALKIKTGTSEGGTFTPDSGSSVSTLVFSKWNEWEDKDFTVVAGKDGAVFAISDDSEITVDDYNVQTAYVGEEFGIAIEAEAEISETVE